MKKISFALIVGLAVLLNSCIAVFGKKKIDVLVHTTDENAVISENGREIGKGTDVRYTAPKTPTVHQIDVSRKGHKTTHNVIYPKGRTPAIYPVQILYFPMLFIPSLVDFGTNNGFSYNKDVKLHDAVPLPQREATGKLVDMEGVYISESLAINNGRSVVVKHRKKGSIMSEIEMADASGKGNDWGGVGFFDAQQVNGEIRDFLWESGYVDTVNKIFKDNNNTISIEGELRSFTRYDVNVPAFSPFYKAKGDVMWFIRNNFGELVDSVARTDFSDDFADYGQQALITDIFENSYINLLNSVEFRDKTQINNDFSSKDAPLIIPRPQKAVKTVLDAQEASVLVTTKNGHGSGFAISNDGYLLTNYHVVADGVGRDSNEIWIQNAGGGKTKATLVRSNKFRDIALLKVDTTFSKAFQLDNAKGHKAFQEVYTIGTPKYTELVQSYQKGVISNDRSAFGIDIIQVSMAVNGGNSGGPLFDNTGRLHGVIVAKLIGYSTEGVGFAIPSHKIQEYLNIK